MKYDLMLLSRLKFHKSLRLQLKFVRQVGCLLFPVFGSHLDLISLYSFLFQFFLVVCIL